MVQYLLILGILFSVPAAIADQQSDMLAYIKFIKEWTSYKYNGEPLPKIKIERAELVQIFAFGDYEYAQAESKGIELPTVLGLYDGDRKTIYVSDLVDPNEPMFSVTLVHELVHYLQDINGYTASLDGHLSCTESEAYDVQMLWQIQYGINVHEVPYVHQRSLIAAMKCVGNQSSAFPKIDLDSIPEIKQYKKDNGI